MDIDELLDDIAPEEQDTQQDSIEVTKRSVGRTNYYKEVVSKRLAEVTEWKIGGLSNKQVASNLGIHEATFYEYLSKYSDFSEAIEKGKAREIAELENAAFKSATGHIVKETKTEQDDSGKTKITVTEKYIPPNPAQNIFLLKNLMPGKYKDRIETVNNINVSIRQIQNLTDEELLKMSNLVEIPTDYQID